MSSTSPAEEKFSLYYDWWLKQLEDHLQQLVALSKEAAAAQYPHQPDYYDSILTNLTAHHKAFYTAKWASAHEDILPFFSPPWLTPLEKAHLWITGWKPSTALRLVESLRRTRVPLTSLTQMSDEQVKKMEELRARTRLEEEKVERDMERQQVGMADRKMVELARLARRVEEEEMAAVEGRREEVDGMVEVAVKGLLVELERVMKTADCVRLKTLKGVLDVLGPRQCVDFLALFSMFHIQLRKSGMKKLAMIHI
ncbi:hypothetical protein Ancab_033965 [Ancistrocladus abbreviatus]